MANVQLNIGDKLSFDANDSPAGSQNTTYFKCPSANPDNAIQAYVANVQTAKFGQGLLEVFAAGSGAGDVVVDGNFKYADSGGRTIQRVIHCMNFVNVAESTSTADLIYYESPGSTPPYYIRMKDLAAPRAQGVVPISLPQGATITGFDMQFRKVAQAGGQSRNMQANLTQWPSWGASSGITTIGSPLEVTNGNGSTEVATKTQTGLSHVVDNDTYSYGVLVNMHNTDSSNTGADGLGLVAFRITYNISTLGG